MKFPTTIFQIGNNTGIEVPERIIEALGAGKKPAVVITVNDYTYRSTVAVMGGKYLIPFSSEHRKNSGIKGGDAVKVTLLLDTEPRTVEIPEPFHTKLKKNKKALQAYEKLPPSGKKKVVTLIESAKTEATRDTRIDKILSSLEKGEKI